MIRIVLVLAILHITLYGCTTKNAKESQSESGTFTTPYSSETCVDNDQDLDPIENSAYTGTSIKKLLGDIPYNTLVNGKKQGIWVEIDSSSNVMQINRYEDNMLNGQSILYGNVNIKDLGRAYCTIYFNEKDVVLLTCISKDRTNVIMSFTDSIKKNEDYIKEAKEFKFRGVGMQSTCYGFDRIGNEESITHEIYDLEGGDDFFIDPYVVGNNIDYDNTSEEKIIKDIRFNIARGKLKRGGCEWTRKLVGNYLLHNYYVDGKKHGIWVERDSAKISVIKYRHGEVAGQRIVYHTPYVEQIAYNPYEIGFYDGDRPKLVYVDVKHNIVRTVGKGFKDNDIFTSEADSLGFKNHGMQYYCVEFDSLGNKLGEGWKIFDYYGGKDFRTDSFKVGKWE